MHVPLELDALKIYFQRAVIFTHCKMQNIGEQLFIEISLVFDGLDFESASEVQSTPHRKGETGSGVFSIS